MFAPKDNTCPMLKAPCIEAKCKWWIHIRGKHPQSHAEIDMPDCSIKWLPILLIENAQEVRQAAAAIESTRNEQARGVMALAQAVKTVSLPSEDRGRVLELKAGS